MPENNNTRMNRAEWRAASSLAAVYAVRMFGLFLLLPVMALYAAGLTATTPLLIGLAIGIYGLTQALLQIPFGMLSDRIGRKPVIFLGLGLFIAGSLLAAATEHIYIVIAGRALQGAGAIAAAIMALATDLSRTEQRSKIMAIIGSSIGATFLLSLILGPLLYQTIGGSGIFYIIALLGLAAIFIVWLLVPPAPDLSVSHQAFASQHSFFQLLTDPQLWRFNSSIFLLHGLMTAAFLVIPGLLQQQFQLSPAQHGLLYFLVMLAALLLMLPVLLWSERSRQTRKVILLAILTLGVAQFGLSIWQNHFALVILWLILFFAAFNLLEAKLPSLVAKRAPLAKRGMAMGLYATLQFLGSFAGGLLGGILLTVDNIILVWILCSLLLLVWLMIATGIMNQPEMMGVAADNMIYPSDNPKKDELAFLANKH